MKDLPRVTPGKIKDDLNNDQDVFYSSDRKTTTNDEISIVKKINNIFASPHHVYKSKVRITFKDKIVEKIIVGKTSTNLITLDGELLKIIDILDIEKI